MEAIYWLLVAHFIGDFLLQSDWMAVNKSKSWVALTAHVCNYTGTIMLGAALGTALGVHAVTYALVNGAAHFVQDAITSRITARLWFFCKVQPGNYIRAEDRGRNAFILAQPLYQQRGGNRHWFFVVIGVDQLLHYATLLITAEWWL